uniref:KIF-binding protein n=1 Tax=Chlamydomonas leiostraca TaxID=1034604 RepID=A0A7S0RL63_9CHLO|mmetsp:Transcript_25481/g.64668  ORF Transcript_25481/g.64668 Transcript_25481/m.64668 type:complete len:343 (+) Transcript_25481:102-1130(+)|eukprot:CAMPEP_0202866842 /NCGR_PEP_ID=MMETSP1391-20130828/8388_1 /ASSEMBLY_ACC=CAM_ASM_000867 /TAXON_ID=1034604 /ORGANISM="Chlamydomonas leiostraca, Strain SAG 11-49" /LENGTH=342 /DNA_ID=CAMNT_0049546829 /DNA_START=102 /DNA_END=1130 /DNA_ORIENTATION=+
MNETVYLIALIFTLGIFVFVMVLKYMQQKKLGKHYCLADIKLKRLSADSPTRKRLEAAKAMFEKGWQVLQDPLLEPHTCLEYFAKAVEIDEMGCGWKQKFENKLEQIGDFFTLPPKDDRDKYCSMLAEAYLVVLLYTVVTLYGKEDNDLEEDYRVVKTRLDVCASLQRDNPMIYKLRADLLQRFGSLADRPSLIKDLRRAITLAEGDKEGKNLKHCEGVDPVAQRAFLLAYCHHALAQLLHKDKDLKGALEHYAKAAEYADPDFVNLADCHFSVTILTLMLAKNVAPLEKPGILVKAMEHYKKGCDAEKRVLRYLPFVSTDVSRKLAKELTKKFAKTRAKSN